MRNHLVGDASSVTPDASGIKINSAMESLGRRVLFSLEITVYQSSPQV